MKEWLANVLCFVAGIAFAEALQWISLYVMPKKPPEDK